MENPFRRALLNIICLLITGLALFSHRVTLRDFQYSSGCIGGPTPLPFGESKTKYIPVPLDRYNTNTKRVEKFDQGSGIGFACI